MLSSQWGNWSIREGKKYERYHTIKIEIRKDLESIGKSPFQEEIVLENYFAGTNRGEVLAQMKEAVQSGVALMVLTGEEGSGKTMICRLFEHEVSPPCKTVFFSRTVDSFEDVVRILAMRLGLDAVIEMDGRNVDQALEQITGFLLCESVALLIIFNEAENIYLATLERIRKMVDRIIGSGARMHILFSGRKAFLENCDQRSICDFQKTDEPHFVLTLISEVETADYLKNCAARLTGKDAIKVLTDEVVGNIYDLAKGNFRMTNILGEESLETHGEDPSFMVLLEKSLQQDIDQVQRVVEQIAVGIAEKVESGTADEGVEKAVVEVKEMQAPKEVVTREVESIALLRLTRDLKKKNLTHRRNHDRE